MTLLDCFALDRKERGAEAGSPGRIFLRLLTVPGDRVVVYYRFACYLRRLRHPRRITNVLAAILLARLSRVPGVELGTQQEIGPGISFPHPHDIVVGHGAIIGKRVTIYNGVTLGARQQHAKDTVKDKASRYPTIEDDVTLFSGAKILGPIRIGHHSTVGANAVVLQSFPPHSNLVGVPARNLTAGENPGTAATAIAGDLIHTPHG